MGAGRIAVELDLSFQMTILKKGGLKLQQSVIKAAFRIIIESLLDHFIGFFLKFCLQEQTATEHAGRKRWSGWDLNSSYVLFQQSAI
jgi:hypothetical protein